MSQLRQLVIAAEDPNRLAAFYQEVFALEKIDENQGAVFLSDGIFNLAIAAGGRPAKQGFDTGLRHDARRIGANETRQSRVGCQRSPEVNSVAGHRS